MKQDDDREHFHAGNAEDKSLAAAAADAVAPAV